MTSLLMALPWWGTTLIIAVPVLLVIILIGVAVGAYNKFVALRNKTEEAFATMDVFLKKRYDLIPNLVETVKGYAKHEKETLQRVIEARNTAQSSTNLTDKINNENAFQSTLKSLFAISEAYPDLKANSQFIGLQSQLKVVEEDIASARRYFNAIINEYNTKCETFPSNIIAKMFKFTRKPSFEIETSERENVKISFD